MERRIAIAWAASASVTIGIATLAIAAVDGVFFVDAAPAVQQDGKRIEVVDDYVVVHSSTTTTNAAPLATGLTVVRAALVSDSNITPAPAPEPILVDTGEATNEPATPAVAKTVASPAPAARDTEPSGNDEEAAEPDHRRAEEEGDDNRDSTERTDPDRDEGDSEREEREDD